jgi:hypothetical protein
MSERELPLEEVSSLVDDELARKNALEDLKKMILDTADVPNLPDVMILHKNEDGELITESLDNLCSLDGKRNKGCKSRVNYLIEDIMFRIKHEKVEGEKPEGETPKKKRRTKAEMEAAKAAAPKA